MKYYKSVAVINKQKAEDAISTEKSEQSVVRPALMKDLSTEHTKSFANTVDADYKREMVDVYSDWIEPRSFLLAPSRMNDYYKYLMKHFPCIHLIFTTIASNSCDNIPVASFIVVVNKNASDKKLHKKHRMRLFLFFTLICTHSWFLLQQQCEQ